MTEEKRCEICKYRKGIVCDLDGGHIGFDWCCDRFKSINDPPMVLEDEQNKTCFNCKYSSIIHGIQSCAWEPGLRSQYKRCDKFERDWGTTIGSFMAFLCVFLVFPGLIIYLLLTNL